MNTFLEKIKFILLFLWQLPQNLIALLMMPFLGKMKLIRYSHYAYAFECLNMRGGISLGNFIFLDKYCSEREVSVYHEYGHVIQSHMLGWLYLFVIGIPSLLNAIFNFTECYYSWYTESWANKLVGLKVKKNKYSYSLYFSNKN